MIIILLGRKKTPCVDALLVKPHICICLQFKLHYETVMGAMTPARLMGWTKGKSGQACGSLSQQLRVGSRTYGRDINFGDRTLVSIVVSIV